MAETQLMRAVKKDPVTAFKLIKKKKDINATNVKGQTALMMAVENNPQLVAPLIEYGANVNVFDKDGNTPLMLAKKYALDVVDILTVAGAKNVKPVMQPGMKLPTRTEVEASKANREFKIELQNGGVKNTYKKRIADKIGDFVEQLLRDGVVSNDNKIEVRREKTTEFTLDKEVIGFRIDLDAKFGEYPDFFQVGKTTDMTVNAGSGLLKLKNLMHKNWKEARKYALNIEDEEEVMDNDPIMLTELEIDDEDKIGYFRDKNGILRIVALESFKSWLNANRDKTNIRGLFGDSYNQAEIRGLATLVDNRLDFNTVISTQNINLYNQRIDQRRHQNREIGIGDINIHIRRELDPNTNVMDYVTTSDINNFDLLNKALRENAPKSLIKKFIVAGADVNHRDNVGNTPFINYVTYWSNYSEQEDYEPDLSIDQLLTRAGANVNLSNPQGNTPLMIAADRNYFIYRQLFDAGADVNLHNNDGVTALMFATRRGVEHVEPLLDAGADIDAKTNNGISVLMYALKDLMSVTEAIVQAGADVNARDNNGKTALMHAAYERPWAVPLFIDAGADVNLLDNRDKTALDYAIEKNNTYTINELRAAGARE